MITLALSATTRGARLVTSAQRKVGGLPRRWVVEQTFSWLGQNGRMSKTYETLLAATS
jgi:transposase